MYNLKIHKLAIKVKYNNLTLTSKALDNTPTFKCDNTPINLIIKTKV